MTNHIRLLMLLVFQCALNATFHAQAPGEFDFKDFPENPKVRNELKQVLNQTVDLPKLKSQMKHIVEQAGIKDFQLKFTTKSNESYIWYHAAQTDQYTALFATRGVDEFITNYSVLLEEWRDTLFVINTFVVSLDSSIYREDLVRYQCIGAIEECSEMNIVHKGLNTLFTQSKTVQNDTYYTIQLAYKSRKEVMTLCFLGAQSQSRLRASLTPYLKHSYSPQELSQIATSWTPTFRHIEVHSLIRFLNR
jgi:hypothetical protein